jgi:hypothetical protein
MSPLDDQLRSAMHGRADVLAPSPDPLAGIESRARGMRRRRVAASVTGAALAVAAAALVVPSLSTGPGPKPAQVASDKPTALGADALDPAHPWAFRGKALTAGTAAHVQDEWRLRHAGSTLTPLYAQVHEPSAQEEAVFVASGGAGGDRYGFVRGSGSGAEFVHDAPLATGTKVLAFAVAGDEAVPRLVVVAAPGSRAQYAPDGTSYTPMTAKADAVAILALEGDQTRDRLRVTLPDGSVVTQEAPDYGPSGASQGDPSNLLSSWPQRGHSSVGPDRSELLTRFAQAFGRTPDKAVYRPLFTGGTDSGVRYTVGQAWFSGEDTAYDVSYATGGTNGPELFLGRATTTAPALLAFVIGGPPGTSTDLLVVVPQPRTGEVLYSPDATAPFAPQSTGKSFDGVVVIDRSATATDDRLELLDGNGNLDQPTYRGPVGTLLCGLKGCG